MKSCRRSPYFLCLAATVALSMGGLGFGCAGDSARLGLSVPVMEAEFPYIAEDAMLGIRARANPAAVAALNAEPDAPQIAVESAGVANSRITHLQQFEEAMRRLGRRGE